MGRKIDFVAGDVEFFGSRSVSRRSPRAERAARVTTPHRRETLAAMRVRPSLLLSLAPALFAPALACSSSSSSGASSPGDGGTGDDGGGPATLSYTPRGCGYTYTPPPTLGYLDLALDDTGPVSATAGKPERVRVGLGGGTTKGQAGYADPSTSAAFTWETAEPNHAAKVKIGTSAASMTTVQTGYAWTLKPTLGSNAYFHEVHLCGLTPGTTYFYAVGGGPAGQEVWSDPLSFTTVPSSGSITVGVFGDARDSATTWQAVHVRMRDAMASLSLVGGDVVDIGGEETFYTQWLDAIVSDPSGKPLTLGRMPILVINGNHEADTSTSFANFALPGTDAYPETYASFDVGNTHFTMLDDQQIAESLMSGTASPEAKAQLAWVDKDLAAASADRAAHPFVVVVAHRGIFSTSVHGADPDVLAARAALAPLYDKYGVDLVLNGHDHEYERTAPLTAGTPPTGSPAIAAGGKGTTYVTCAGAGADAYGAGTATPWRTKSATFGTGTPYIGVYSLLTLSGSTLTLSAYGLKASSTTVKGDDVVDTLQLTH